MVEDKESLDTGSEKVLLIKLQRVMVAGVQALHQQEEDQHRVRAVVGEEEEDGGRRGRAQGRGVSQGSEEEGGERQ